MTCQIYQPRLTGNLSPPLQGVLMIDTCTSYLQYLPPDSPNDALFSTSNRKQGSRWIMSCGREQWSGKEIGPAMSLAWLFQTNSGYFEERFFAVLFKSNSTVENLSEWESGPTDEDDYLVSIIRISNSNGWENKDERDNQGFQIQIWMERPIF